MSSLHTLAGEIASRGVGYAFGVTGSGATLTLADALEKAGVEIVRTQFEGNAAIMAGTVGRLTGKAGVAFCIKGPGLANMVPGLAVSWFEHYPLIAICEAYPPGSSAAKAHKLINHAHLTQAVTKGRRVLGVDAPGFAELCHSAEAEIPGPVVLELAGIEDGGSPQPMASAAACGEDLQLLTLVRQARRPVIIAGTLAIRLGLPAALNRLCIPVFSTAAAKGVVNETLPHAAGVHTGVGLALAPETQLLAEADLVIGIGLRPNEVLATKPFPCPAVNVEPLAQLPGSEAFGFVAVSGSSQLPALLNELAGKAWGLDLVTDSLGRMHARLADSPFLPAQAFAGIAAHFGSAVRMVMDTGYFCTIGEHVWRAPRPELCLLSGQGRYMGTGLSMGIAAALTDSSVPTVVVVGDGGIGASLGELRIALERRLPLLVVLMTDGRFGSIRTRALKDRLSESSLTIGNPSWIPTLAGMGLPAWIAADRNALAAALAAWQPAEGPAYIEIPYPADPYEQMVRNIR